ncbi:unnamed protein product [Rangifer tarandus platyrhynchus]|uniref:Uncharacterized protein n=1 Tax=Rangifer tarandus platyrhynchus TaxID=3082113 RepID=A0AC59Z6N0_RANTA
MGSRLPPGPLSADKEQMLLQPCPPSASCCRPGQEAALQTSGRGGGQSPRPCRLGPPGLHPAPPAAAPLGPRAWGTALIRKVSGALEDRSCAGVLQGREEQRVRRFHNKKDDAPAGPPLCSWDQVSIQATLTRGGGAVPGQRAPAARLALKLSREPATSSSE